MTTATKSLIGSNTNFANLVMESATIPIKGMTCKSCVKKIENHFQGLSGVKTCSVNLIQESGQFLYDNNQWNVDNLSQQIKNLGFSTTTHLESTTSLSSSHNDDDPSAIVQTCYQDEDIKCYLKVMGMTCSSCVNLVETHLMKVEGVKSVLVALLAMKCEVVYDAAYIMPFQLAHRVEELGFQFEVIETNADGISVINVSIQGMTCSSCVNDIEISLSKKKGIVSVNVVLTTASGRIEYRTSESGPRDIIEMIEDMGFEAALYDDKQLNHRNMDQIMIRKISI